MIESRTVQTHYEASWRSQRYKSDGYLDEERLNIILSQLSKIKRIGLQHNHLYYLDTKLLRNFFESLCQVIYINLKRNLLHMFHDLQLQMIFSPL